MYHINMDIYKRQNSSDETTLLYLKEMINHNVDICKYILNIKKELENKETMEYYIERWDNIAGAHYILHDTHRGMFSIIFNETHYIVKPDHKLIFYNRTGISYQIIELIHQLIILKNDELLENTLVINYKEWLNWDDQLYSLLSKKITEKMKEIPIERVNTN